MGFRVVCNLVMFCLFISFEAFSLECQQLVRPNDFNREGEHSDWYYGVDSGHNKEISGHIIFTGDRNKMASIDNVLKFSNYIITMEYDDFFYKVYSLEYPWASVNYAPYILFGFSGEYLVFNNVKLKDVIVSLSSCDRDVSNYIFEAYSYYQKSVMQK